MEKLNEGVEKGAVWEIYRKNEDELEIKIRNPNTNKEVIRSYFIIHPLEYYVNNHKIGIIIRLAASEVMHVYH